MVSSELRQRNWSLRHASAVTGVNHSVINNMVQGVSVAPRQVEDFARACGLDPVKWRALAAGIPADRILPAGLPAGMAAVSRQDILSALVKFESAESVRIPVISAVQDGAELLDPRNEQGEAFVSRQRAAKGALFAVPVRGSAMRGKGVEEGAMVIACKDDAPKPGDIVVVQGEFSEGKCELYVRRFGISPEGEPVLETHYDGLVSDINPLGNARIVGVATEIRRTLHD
jgi:SOS-response transcriptional repressor LexA